MITPKLTAVMVAMTLMGSAAPAAFAQLPDAASEAIALARGGDATTGDQLNVAVVEDNEQEIEQNQEIESENEIETGDASVDQTAQTGFLNIPDIIIPPVEEPPVEDTVFCVQNESIIDDGGIDTSCFETIEECEAYEEFLTGAGITVVSECEAVQTPPPDAVLCAAIIENGELVSVICRPI